jgi:hypothetical protein
VAQLRQDNRDHRNSPLRGSPVMTPRGFLRAVIYGDAGDEKREPSTRCP